MTAYSSAEEAFAHYVALRESSRPIDFEDWVCDFPQFEPELRRLEQGWSSFEQGLGLAFDPRAPSFFHRPGSRDLLAPFPTLHFVAGQAIGEFRLVQLVGRGGMGEVWEAFQPALDRRVALKFIRPEYLSPRAVAFFEKEARAGGRLFHPAIVTVFATGEDEGIRWIAQELVADGATLHDFLRSQASAPDLPADYDRRIAGLFLQIAQAVQHAHEAGVIHRDLKPQNILVTPDDRPKVGDFGLAQLIEEMPERISMQGTLAYMSPEQAAATPEGIAPTSDVFSLGAMLYEALTLRRAFQGDSASLLTAVRNVTPPHPRSVRPNTSSELAAIALKALAKKPAERYPSMREVAAELERYLRDEPVLAQPVAPWTRMAKWMRRHPTATAVGALALVLVASTTYLGNRWAAAQGETLEQRKELLLTRAWRNIDVGDLDSAELDVQELTALDPSDPRGHLVLASGLALRFRIQEVEAALEAAAAAGGWSPDTATDESAETLFMGALSDWIEQDFGPSRKVEALLTEALRLDPKFEAALFPLYHVRRELDDAPGAREALMRYRNVLRVGDPQLQRVEALVAELDGDRSESAEILRTLRAEGGEPLFSRLQGPRVLGRVLSKLYLESGDVEELKESRQLLERAVAEVPNDFASSTLLAWVLILQHEASSTAERVPLADLAYEVATRAHEAAPHYRDAVEVRARAAAARLRSRWDGENFPPEEIVDAALEAVGELEDLDPAHTTPGWVRSEILCMRASLALQEGRLDEAEGLLEESVETSALQLPARVVLGQHVYMRYEDDARALQLFQEALSIWEQWASRWQALEVRIPEERRWLFAIYSWSFAACDRSGDLACAAGWADMARTELEEAEQQLPDLFSFAEFLGTARHPELRDCQLAARILKENPRIEDLFGEDQPQVFAAIRNCPGGG